MSQLPIEKARGVGAAAREAAAGQVVYLTENGQRLAAIVPAEFGAMLEGRTPEQVAELLNDVADAAAARKSIETGDLLIAWDEIEAETGR